VAGRIAASSRVHILGNALTAAALCASAPA